jgi:hypothetical protein
MSHQHLVPLIFLLRIVFTIQGLLYFYMNFRIDLSTTVKNGIGILMGIALYVQDCFWQYSHFHNAGSLTPWTWEVFPCSGIFYDFFHQIFMVFVIEVFNIFVCLCLDVFLRQLWVRFFFWLLFRASLLLK